MRKVYNLLYTSFPSVFFKYLITGRLDNSYYNLILNPSWKQQLLLQFWVPTEKTQSSKSGWIHMPTGLKFHFSEEQYPIIRYTVSSRSLIRFERGYDVNYLVMLVYIR